METGAVDRAVYSKMGDGGLVPTVLGPRRLEPKLESRVGFAPRPGRRAFHAGRATTSVCGLSGIGWADPTPKDLNRLSRVGSGGHPIAHVGASIGYGIVEYQTHPFVEYRYNPRAVVYLQTLRVPFLTLLCTRVARMPATQRWN